jgi:RNA polymerase sigma factor (sigma-70 family)
MAHEEEERGHRLRTEAQAPPARWNWDALDAELRPRCIRAGVARFGLSPEEAEDVYHRVLLCVVSLSPRVSDPVSYVKRGFRNAAINRLRTEGRTPAQVPLTDLPGPSPAWLTHDEIDRLLKRAFQMTDPLCGKIIRRYYLDRRTLAETASEAGYSPKTIWRKVQLCLAMMRRNLA